MDQLQLDIQPKDSSKIQLASVIAFMQQLKYEYLTPTRSFTSGHPYNKGKEYISLNTAILLHNNFYTECHGKWLDYPFDNIPSGWFQEAKASKIVKTVSLQNSRKRGILVGKHWVKFADTENGKLFLKSFLK